LHLLLSPSLICFPCFMYSTPQRNPNEEKFWVPYSLLPKSFFKILLAYFLGLQLAPGIPSWDLATLQYIYKELVALRLQGEMRGTTLLHRLPVLMYKDFQIMLLVSIHTNSMKNRTHPRFLKICYPSRIQHLEGIIEGKIWHKPLLKTNRPLLLLLRLHDTSIGTPRSVWWWSG
jgi:hypothetical protein